MLENSRELLSTFKTGAHVFQRFHSTKLPSPTLSWQTKFTFRFWYYIIIIWLVNFPFFKICIYKINYIMIYIIITSYRWIKKNNGESDSLNQRNQQNYIKLLRVYFCWRQMDGLENTFLFNISLFMIRVHERCSI